MSKYYIVKVEEVHISHMLIEADTEEQALEHWTEGDELRCEYHHTVDDFNREVEEFNPLDYSGEELSRARLDNREIEERLEAALGKLTRKEDL